MRGGRYAFAHQILFAGRLADAAGPQRTATAGNVAGSGWENIAFTVVRVKLSQRYKGNKDDNFGDTSVLHEQAGCGTKRSQRLESHADQSGDVLFAMVKEVDARPAASLKTSPELADLLRQQHDDVRPSKHLNKAHWSTVFLDGSLPDSQIYYGGCVVSTGGRTAAGNDPTAALRVTITATV